MFFVSEATSCRCEGKELTFKVRLATSSRTNGSSSQYVLTEDE
jgi:hypothetical protein